MSDDVSKIVGGKELNASLEVKRVIAEERSELKGLAGVVGGVVLIQDSEKLGPAAYGADGAGVEAFALYSRNADWVATHCYEGKLEGRGSLKSPDGHYMIWLFRGGTHYFKWIEADWQSMQEEIAHHRSELREKMARAVMKDNFTKLLLQLKCG